MSRVFRAGQFVAENLRSRRSAEIVPRPREAKSDPLEHADRWGERRQRVRNDHRDTRVVEREAQPSLHRFGGVASPLMLDNNGVPDLYHSLAVRSAPETSRANECGPRDGRALRVWSRLRPAHKIVEAPVRGVRIGSCVRSTSLAPRPRGIVAQLARGIPHGARLQAYVTICHPAIRASFTSSARHIPAVSSRRYEGTRSSLIKHFRDLGGSSCLRETPS